MKKVRLKDELLHREGVLHKALTLRQYDSRGNLPAGVLERKKGKVFLNIDNYWRWFNGEPLVEHSKELLQSNNDLQKTL